MCENKQVKCRGIFGWLFGHKYDHIFNILDSGPVYTPSDGILFHRNITEKISEIMEACHSKKRIYKHSICVRCGNVIKAHQEESK